MKKKIHVLYTIPNFDTVGGGKALLNIASRLDKDRFEVSIACFHTRGAFFEKVRQSGIPVHVFEFTASMKNRFKGLLDIWRISRKFRKLNPDIVHSWHYLNDYTEPMAVRLAGKKWVFTKNNMAWGGRAWKVRGALANGIIAQNTDIVRDFFPKKRNIKVIGRGININEFSPMEPSASLRAKYGLGENSLVIMCVANLVPVKGVEVLMEAFGSLALKYPDTYLMIVGDDANEYGASLKKLASETPRADRILFTGKISNVNEHLSVADITVLPTLNKGRGESFGVALIEAMAMEKYVLASDLAGPKDQLKNFPSYLFPSGNVAALTDAIDKALAIDKSERARAGKALRQEVIDRFTIEREVRDHENFYDSLFR